VLHKLPGSFGVTAREQPESDKLVQLQKEDTIHQTHNSAESAVSHLLNMHCLNDTRICSHCPFFLGDSAHLQIAKCDNVSTPTA